MSSSYVVKYTMNGDSQRPLRWKTHGPQSTGAEFIMPISIRLLFLQKIIIITHPINQESPTQINR